MVYSSSYWNIYDHLLINSFYYYFNSFKYYLIHFIIIIIIKIDENTI